MGVRPLAQRVEHRAQLGEIRLPRLADRRADGDEDEVGVGHPFAERGGDRDAVAVAREGLGQAGLLDRHVAADQLVAAGWIGLDEGDLVTDVGEVDAGDQPDVAGADDGDFHDVGG